MRGEHALRGAPARRARGIIPACAGSTAETGRAMLGDAGSSPHARGARGDAE